MKVGIAQSAPVWLNRERTLKKVLHDTEPVVAHAASEHGLNADIACEDVFHAMFNSELAVNLVRDAVGADLICAPEKSAQKSEDFCGITVITEGACLEIGGGGTNIPDLHNFDYDFPEEVIPLAKTALLRIIKNSLVAKEEV